MPFFRRKIRIEGEVVSYRFTMYLLEEGTAYETLLKRQEDLEQGIRELMGKQVGMKELELRELTIQRGSIEVLIIIGAVTTFFLNFSRYKSFVESLQLLKSQIGEQFRRYISHHGVVSIRSSTLLGPSFIPTRSEGVNLDFQVSLVLLLYVIISHAALLTVFIWLLIKKLQ
jgi:hypothetical protein